MAARKEDVRFLNSPAREWLESWMEGGAVFDEPIQRNAKADPRAFFPVLTHPTCFALVRACHFECFWESDKLGLCSILRQLLAAAASSLLYHLRKTLSLFTTVYPSVRNPSCPLSRLRTCHFWRHSIRSHDSNRHDHLRRHPFREQGSFRAIPDGAEAFLAQVSKIPISPSA